MTVLRPVAGSVRGERTRWEDDVTVWANVTHVKGARALMRGEVTAYETVLIRMRWRGDVTRYCRFRCDGRIYAVESFFDDMQANTLQITAKEVHGNG